MVIRPEELWTGAGLTLPCPIDGSALFVDEQPTLIGIKTRVRVNHHVHVGFNARATCAANGHKWQIKNESLIIEQVGEIK